MGYVSGFEYDVFVSYSHLDDDAQARHPGWVTTFALRLRSLIESSLGKDIELHFDKISQNHADRIEELEGKARRSAIVVSMLSPRYGNSEWGKREVDAYLEQSGAGDHALVVEIIPPLNNGPRPAWLPNKPRAQFWTQDKLGRHYVVLQKQSKAYRDKINDLANEISALLERMKDGQRAAPLEAADRDVKGAIEEVARSPVIYLAYGSSDVDYERGVVRDYLEDLGVTVLPKPFARPDSVAGYEAAVSQGVAGADIFVQLLGPRPAALPAGSAGSSATQDQFDRAKKAGCQLVLWRPRWLNVEELDEGEHRTLLESEHVEVPNIPEFNKSLARRVTALADPPPPLAGEIFISADQRDDDYARDLYLVCRNRQIAARKTGNLRVSFAAADTVTFVWGWSGEEWLQAQYDIYRKARATTGAVGPTPLVVCIGPPREEDDLVPFYEPGMEEIDVRKGWTTQPFEDLLDRMRA